MDKKTKRSPYILMAIASVLLVGGGAGYYFLWATLHDVVGQVQEVAVGSGVRFSKSSSEKRMVGVAQSSQQDRDALNGYFIADNAETIEFIELVESLAEAVDIEMDLVIRPERDLDRISFRITTVGTYNEIRKHLGLLESLPYNVEITRATLLRTAQKEEFEHLWSGNFDLLFIGYNGNSV